MKLAVKLLEACKNMNKDKKLDEAAKKAWVDISNDLNQALVKARKFCKEHKLHNQEKEIDSALKIFLKVDDVLSDSGKLDEAVPTWDAVVKAVGSEGAVAYVVYNTLKAIHNGESGVEAFTDACDNENLHGDKPEVVKARGRAQSVLKSKFRKHVEYKG